MPQERWSEAKVFGMLKGPFPDGAYVRIPQVRNGTGYTRRTRTADALIVSCWPSRGLWFAGVEIKVSTYDWKKELSQPDKSAEIQKWCHYWYVAAPAGVVPIGEVPPTWGVIECGRNCKILRPAPRLEPQPLDAAFLAAVLRAATDGLVPSVEVEKLAQERAEKLAESKAYDSDYLRKKIDEFRKETGIDIFSTWEYGHVKEAIDLVKASKSNGLEYLAKSIRGNAESLVKLGGDTITLCNEILASGELPKRGTLPSRK